MMVNKFSSSARFKRRRPIRKSRINKPSRFKSQKGSFLRSFFSIFRINRKNLLHQGSGFIATSDGLIASAYNLVDGKFDQIVVSHADWQSEATVEKKDAKTGLVLLKIERNNLPVVAMADLQQLQIGQRIILIGLEKEIEGNNFYKFVNIGYIRGIKDSILAVNLEEENLLANGGPLIDIKGQVIGLNLIGNKGLVKTIPTDKIKQAIFE